MLSMFWAGGLLLLGAGGVAIGYGLRPQRRGAWLVATLVALTALGLGVALPAPTSPIRVTWPWAHALLGQWQPWWEWSAATWPWALVALSLPAVSLLTGVQYAAARPPAYVWAGVLALGGVEVFGALTGNLLSLVGVWALLDGVALGLAFLWPRAEEERGQAVALAWARSLGWVALLGSLWASKSAASTLLLLAILWRLTWQPWEVVGARPEHPAFGLGVTLRRGQVLLTLSALRFWPSGAGAFPVALGVLLALVGVGVWMVQRSPVAGDGLGLALGSMALWAMAQGVPEAATGLVVLAVLGATVADVGWDRTWVAWPAWAVVVISLVGAPWTPGAALPRFWQSLRGGARFFLGFLWLGVGMGLWRRVGRRAPGHQWASLTAGSRGAYWLGSNLIALVVLRWSLSQKPGGKGSLWTGVALALSVLLWWGGMYLRRRLALPAVSFSFAGMRQRLGAWLWAVYRTTRRVLAFATGLMEGEGGVLWAMVLLGGLMIWMLWGPG